MSRLAIPALIALVVALLPTTLLAIGFAGPLTHENLVARFDPSYNRSDQNTVGPPPPLPPAHQGAQTAGTSLVERGKALMVSQGCAACHGLEGRGGAVGPPILGFASSKFRLRTRKGPGGMPAYDQGALTDDDLAAIEAYLDSLVAAGGTSGK